MHAKDPLPAIVGQTDIYLLDQIMRENIAPPMRILDVGAGKGRNLRYFLKAGYPVLALEPRAESFAALQEMARKAARHQAAVDLRQESLQDNSFPDHAADVVLCNAVLHMARDRDEFDAMLHGAWRLLAPGGLFFARLASSIGIEALVDSPTGWQRIPDGTRRFLVDTETLEAKTQELGATWVDPLKTTVVARERAMSTWVLRKN
ncbi:MAG: class I SAM-dependent methyltransferase [Planctomycetes bacterium]|nr:class I SAM-dependent methyltransferase [Planctomycetota bacterium]